MRLPLLLNNWTSIEAHFIASLLLLIGRQLASLPDALICHEYAGVCSHGKQLLSKSACQRILAG